jgi:GntR family transcriptional regulator
MIEVSRFSNRSRVPLYLQVASAMRARIDSKQWLPGQRIPALSELQEEYRITRVTIRKAIDTLSREGLLWSKAGRGTFLTDKVVSRQWYQLATTWDALIDQIKDNVPKRVDVVDPPEFPSLREGEGRLAPEYVFMRSLQYKDGDPYVVVSVHLSNDVFRLARRQFSRHPALSVLGSIEKVKVRDAHQTVSIGTADMDVAQLLNIELGATVAECRCAVIDDSGAAIYIADIIYRKDAIKLHIDLLANRGEANGRLVD